MEFLMSAFERVIKQYGYKFSLTRNKNGTYGLDFYDLPPELDYRLIILQYEKPRKIIAVKAKHKREMIPILKIDKENICKPVRGKKCNIVHVDLCKDDYATKINKIQVCLRSYFEDKRSNGFI